MPAGIVTKTSSVRWHSCSGQMDELSQVAVDILLSYHQCPHSFVLTVADWCMLDVHLDVLSFMLISLLGVVKVILLVGDSLKYYCWHAVAVNVAVNWELYGIYWICDCMLDTCCHSNSKGMCIVRNHCFVKCFVLWAIHLLLALHCISWSWSSSCRRQQKGQSDTFWPEILERQAFCVPSGCRLRMNCIVCVVVAVECKSEAL